MEEYIPKSVLIAEIEKRRDAALTRQHNLKAIGQETVLNEMVAYELNRIISFLDTIEVKKIEEEEELHGLEKEVAYGIVNRINRKRIPINLKGAMKAKFKNEFNTMWQVIDGIQFAKVAKHIVERLCLEFATWGAYNLKDIGETKGLLDTIKEEPVSEDLAKNPELSGWVARDKDGNLHVFEVKPKRSIDDCRWWDRDYKCSAIDKNAFRDLKWEDEPVCVKLIIIKED